MKYRKAVFALVYFQNKDKIEYLILKRKLHWRGWEFPKGAIEKFETKKGAVKREVFEETGLRVGRKDVKRFDFSGKYLYEKVLQDRPEFRGQTFFLYSVKVSGKGIKISREEHSDYKWASFDKALRMLKWPNQKKSLKMVNAWLTHELQKKSS